MSKKKQLHRKAIEESVALKEDTGRKKDNRFNNYDQYRDRRKATTNLGDKILKELWKD